MRRSRRRAGGPGSPFAEYRPMRALSPTCGRSGSRRGGGGGGIIRNGTRPQTVRTDAAGKVDIEVPRDRAGTFEPVIVKKRQRRLNDVDAVAIS